MEETRGPKTRLSPRTGKGQLATEPCVHSWRRDSTGSMPAARSAGKQHAPDATVLGTRTTAAMVTGSKALPMKASNQSDS